MTILNAISSQINTPGIPKIAERVKENGISGWILLEPRPVEANKSMNLKERCLLDVEGEHLKTARV